MLRKGKLCFKPETPTHASFQPMLTLAGSSSADAEMDGGIADDEMNDAIDATIEAEAAHDDKNSEVFSAVGMTPSKPKAKTVTAKGKASTPGAEDNVEVPEKE